MAQYARPDADLSDDGNWESTEEDMGSPIFYTAIDESSADTGTYVTGADDGAGNELIVGLDNNITDPGVTTGHKLITRWKTDEGGTSGGTLVVTLLESSTTRMQVSIDTTNEGSWTTTTHAPTNTTGTIGNYNNLKIKFEYTDDDASVENVLITQAYLEAPDEAEDETATSPAFLMFVDL